jgi:hypothetical protein
MASTDSFWVMSGAAAPILLVAHVAVVYPLFREHILDQLRIEQMMRKYQPSTARRDAPGERQRFQEGWDQFDIAIRDWSRRAGLRTWVAVVALGGTVCASLALVLSILSLARGRDVSSPFFAAVFLCISLVAVCAFVVIQVLMVLGPKDQGTLLHPRLDAGYYRFDAPSQEQQ